MTTLLNKIRINFRMDYDVCKDDETHRIYINQAKLKDDSIIGEVSVDRIDLEQRIWVYAPRNPAEFFFGRRTEKYTREKPVRVFAIDDVILAKFIWKDDSLKQFIEQFQTHVIIQHKSMMSKENIALFFEKAHMHYMNFFR